MQVRWLSGHLWRLLRFKTTYYHENQSGGAGAVLMPLVVMAVPLYDFLSVTFLRISQGKSPFVGDTQHFSHRLKRRGLSDTQTALTLYLATLMHRLWRDVSQSGRCGRRNFDLCTDGNDTGHHSHNGNDRSKWQKKRSHLRARYSRTRWIFRISSSCGVHCGYRLPGDADRSAGHATALLPTASLIPRHRHF